MAAASGQQRATPLRGRRRRDARRRFRQNVLFATVAFVGIAVMLYPATASWFSAVAERSAVTTYTETVGGLDPDEREAALAAAEAYNSSLAGGLIVDPFSTDDDGDVPLDEDAQRYLDELDLDPDGVMSRITIPEIGVDLPIYHGSTDAVLDKGAGHIYGSSLPVGGTSTHAVITGHSGVPQATLFTDLDKLEIGDEFQITTLGRVMTYRVTTIEVVDPGDISSLGVVPGEDLVSLVTCTPIGINTQRLVVQGERVDDAAAPAAQATLALPFPWWAVGLGAAAAGWCVVFGWSRGRARRSARARRPVQPALGLSVASSP